MAPSNTFQELFWPLSFQKGFPSPLQGPPEPQKSLFYLSKTTVFRNPLWSQNGLFWTPFWTLLGPFSLPCPPQWRPKCQKGPFQKTSKKTLGLRSQNDSQNDLKNGVIHLALGCSGSILVLIRFQTRPRPHFGHFWVLFWNRFDYFQTCFQLEIQTL